MNSCGYFLYDFVAMAYFKMLDSGMTIHHFICVTGMYLCLLQGISANYLIAGVYISEVSNPVMHARMVVKHLGMRYTKTYELLEVSYISKISI
jgi:hypothetical protein